jgi:hypothetical protein
MCFIRSNNQFVTEIGLAKYLPLHPCHTDDPSLADAFIVPVQVSLHSMECLKEDCTDFGT